MQKFLFKEGLCKEAKTIVGVIHTLIYGVRSVAAQSEAGIGKLCDSIQDKSIVPSTVSAWCPISPQRLRTAVMQSMGEKCRLQQIVNWMLLHGYLKPRRATAKAKAAMAKGKAQARRRWATTITPGRIVSS